MTTNKPKVKLSVKFVLYPDMCWPPYRAFRNLKAVAENMKLLAWEFGQDVNKCDFAQLLHLTRRVYSDKYEFDVSLERAVWMALEPADTIGW